MDDNPINNINPTKKNTILNIKLRTKNKFTINDPPDTLVKTVINEIDDYLITNHLKNLIFTKPPKNATNPNDSKTPKMPSKTEDYYEPKNRPN